MARATSFDIQKARDVGLEELSTIGQGFVSQSFDRTAVQGTFALAASTVYFVLFGARAEDTVTSVNFIVTTGSTSAASDTDRTGFVAVYDKNGNLMASSASSASVFRTAGLATFSLSTPLTIPRHDSYFAALVNNITTPATLARGMNTAGVSASVTGFPRPYGNATSSSLPPAATVGSASVALWVGIT